MSKNLLNSFRLVLVRPQFGGNLGAIARVASNFDLRETVLVDAFASIHDSEAKKYATNIAREFLDHFQSKTDLYSAILDCRSAIGFTARKGAGRMPSISFSEIASLAQNSEGPLALVFGNEQTGLNAEELKYCTHICEIPTAELHKSLNLSHAVAVVVARIFEEMVVCSGRAQSQQKENPAVLADFEKMAEALEAVLKRLPFPTNESHERSLLRVRKILGRANLTSQDLELLEKLLGLVQKVLSINP